MAQSVELLQGTLDMLILKAVSLGPLHGYGVLLRIHQIAVDGRLAQSLASFQPVQALHQYESIAVTPQQDRCLLTDL